MPYQRMLPNDAAYTYALEDLAKHVLGGAIYHGTKLETVLDTIRVLRQHPELAAALLSAEDNVLDSTNEPDVHAS